MTAVLNSLPECLLELARASGATAAEVYASHTLSRPAYFEANRLKQLESVESLGIALRVWRHGRPGLAVAYGAVAPQDVVDRALAVSDLSDPEDPYLAPAIAIAYPSTYGQGVTVDELVEAGKAAIAQVRGAFPDVLCAAEWSCDRETVRVVNSNGCDGRYTEFGTHAYVSAEWIRGDDLLEVGLGTSWRGEIAPAAIAQALQASVCQRLAWAKHTDRPLPGKIPVLFTAQAADTLLGTVVAALNGRQVLQGASPWGDRVGKRVVSERIALSQDPAASPYEIPFDDEGTPCVAMTWIDRGVLQGFYGDRMTCHKLGVPLHGNGFRYGLGSTPAPGIFNAIVAPGEGTLLDLAAQMGNGLIVDRILGEGADLTGDFSAIVDLGYRVRNGAIAGRVKDTMVTGNAYAALAGDIALGSDREWVGSAYLPSLLVDGLSVASRH